MRVPPSSQRSPVNLRAAPVAAPLARLGEGPWWDAASGKLYWVDAEAARLHWLDPASRTSGTITLTAPASALAGAVDGRLILCLGHSLAFLDVRGGTTQAFAEIEADRPETRMNDASCDSRGRLWVGTMAFDARPGAGSLYRVSPDGLVTRILEGVTVSNGLAWSVDDRRMYYVDSAEWRIDTFDFDVRSGSIGRRRPFVEFTAAEGKPDGLTVDSDDHVWVALWEGGCVRRYTPAGQLDCEVAVPAHRVTNCVFGGDDLRNLYVTSARPRQDSERVTSAGALYECRPGASGLPASLFGGGT